MKLCETTKKLMVAFSGPSNSGKTTLIVKIAQLLKQKYKKKVVILKHDPKNKARFDVKGKDSYKFFDCGADVVVTSPSRTTYFAQDAKDLSTIIEMIGLFDILLIEGHKDFQVPRIGVFHQSIEESYLRFVDAVATDEKASNFELLNKQKNVTILKLDDLDQILNWICKNAKEI